MSDNNQNPEMIFDVVINHEEQYSIWLADKTLPAGWRKVGQQGPRDACLEYIREVWTDMRPRSLREKMSATDQ